MREIGEVVSFGEGDVVVKEVVDVSVCDWRKKRSRCRSGSTRAWLKLCGDVVAFLAREALPGRVCS